MRTYARHFFFNGAHVNVPGHSAHPLVQAVQVAVTVTRSTVTVTLTSSTGVTGPTGRQAPILPV